MKFYLTGLLWVLAGSLVAQNVNELNKADVENALKVKLADVKPDSAKNWSV
jgi:hypothetical protein